MDYALPPLFTIFLWWFSTGLILLLVRLPRRTYGWSLAAMTFVAVFTLSLVTELRDTTTIASAYLSFTAGIVLWGWLEMTFLTGMVTGPTQPADAPRATGWRHVWHAVQAILYHELSLILIGVVLLALTWHSANQLAFWTFFALWMLRLSAKLNVFLGVPSFSDSMLPAHLDHLRRYFTKAPMNLLFPLSVSIGTGAVALLLNAGLHTSTDAFATSGMLLLAAIVALGVIEHWFMVLKLPDAALWNWFLKTREPPAVTTGVSG
ncbi:MAG: putative photosynthetic complex assembly protein PuhE [Pseudomonadota bacterium]